jgi:hypothetical protein
VLVAAAVLPHPPLLIGELATGAAAELDELRTACSNAVARVAAVAADVTFVVGADIGLRATSFAPWGPGAPGADVTVDVPEPLPLPLLVGARATAGTVRSFVVVDPTLDAAECAALGADLATAADRVALIVMGDGSARHSTKAPGYIDARADPFDRAVAAAFAEPDPAGLLRLDPTTAAALLVAGRGPWQVLAGAAAGQEWTAHEPRWDVPYGVSYHLVTWLVAGQGVSNAKFAR